MSDSAKNADEHEQQVGEDEIGALLDVINRESASGYGRAYFSAIIRARLNKAMNGSGTNDVNRSESCEGETDDSV